MGMQFGARLGGCVAAAALLLGGAQAARAQEPASDAASEAVGQVVFSLEQMPHIPTRSLDEMSAARIKPPGDLTRDYLVNFQGLAAAEELRAEDRALRLETLGEGQGDRVFEGDAADLRELSGASLGAATGNQAN